jgi:ubiquinone/menaquinone biosynthesis C-methylase UbiE
MGSTDTPHRPNHHAHHPGFAGLSGGLAALTMIVGRDGDARLAAERTGLRTGDRLVDLGCGPGAAARFAARRGARVTGVDPAPVMLDLARRLTRRGAGDVTYAEGAAEAIPLPDASADVVWALATVHHWPSLEPALAEVVRVLVPGGRFLAAEKRTKPDATGLASHGWTDEQAEAFASLCRDAGFADVTIATHKGRRRRVVSVLARRPSESP